MTPFEEQFVSDCLTRLEQILSSRDRLNQAYHAYCNGIDHPRYQSAKYNTDTACWTAADLTSLNAAIFEAIAQATYALHTKGRNLDQALLIDIECATAEFRKFAVPKLTFNCDPGNPLASVVRKIPQVKAALNTSTFSDNSYAFFSAIGESAVALATVTAVAAAAAASLYFRK